MATLLAPDHHNPIEDAEVLRKAVEGWGTDEKSIIKILGRRNASQRTVIRQTYQKLYEEDLIRRLEKEINGDFERALYRWVLEPADRDAVILHVAVRKTKVDHLVIAEISCSRSPEELLAVRKAYKNRNKRSLEEDLAAHTSGTIRKLLVSLAASYRYDGAEIDAKLAKSEAEVLHKSIKSKTFDNDDFVRIVSTRSKLQLVATFNYFKDAYGTSITKDLPRDPSDEYAMSLRAAIRCVEDPKKYLEKVVRMAVSKTGTDEDALTRVIVTRAEKDLKHVKELFFQRNSVHLDQAVAKETSGHYKDFLLTLLGKEG